MGGDSYVSSLSRVSRLKISEFLISWSLGKSFTCGWSFSVLDTNELRGFLILATPEILLY